MSFSETFFWIWEIFGAKKPSKVVHSTDPVVHVKLLSREHFLKTTWLCFDLTPLKSSQGTPVRGGWRPCVSIPRSCRRRAPASDSAQARTASGEVVVTPSVSRQRSAEVGGNSAPMMQFIRVTCSEASGTWAMKLEATLYLYTATWSRRQACTLLPWHSSSPCWHSKLHPPSVFSVNFNVTIVKTNASAISALTFAFPKGLKSIFKRSAPKYSQFG